MFYVLFYLFGIFRFLELNTYYYKKRSTSFSNDEYVYRNKKLSSTNRRKYLANVCEEQKEYLQSGVNLKKTSQIWT